MNCLNGVVERDRLTSYNTLIFQRGCDGDKNKACLHSKEGFFRMQRRLLYDTKKASLEMRDVVVGK